MSNAFAYTYSVGTHGEHPHWDESGTYFYYNPTNSSSMSDTEVKNILSSSVAQWKGISDFTPELNVVPTGQTLSGRNEIYFSDSSTIFSGGGVIGVTQLTYYQGSGEIIQADVVLNDSYSFSKVAGDDRYLGDVVTHELGHAFGIGHSEVNFSTMFYKLTPGQHTISHDDNSAMRGLYPTNISIGSLSGKIIGGDDLTAVFGAHVQAISQTSGMVTASALSDDNGSFTITGLDLDDDYYLYISPVNNISALTPYYYTIKDNFCGSSSSYKGSFYEKCGEEGYPTPVRLTSSVPSRHVGNITIKCSIQSPEEFILSGGDITLTGPAHAYTGFNTISDYPSKKEHTVTIDLSSETITNDMSLSLKTVSQKLNFGGVYKFLVSSDQDATEQEFTVSSPDSNGDSNLELNARYNLDTGTTTVTVKIVAQEIQAADEEFFSDTSFYSNTLAYTFIYNLQKNSGGVYTNIEETEASITDNYYCPKGDETYSVSSNSTTYTPVETTTTTEEAVGCGTIYNIENDNSSGPGGPMALALGFILMLTFSRLKNAAFIKF